MMLLLLASQTHAAAYYFLDSGTRAIGRGGAFVAGADDLSAQYYNPAALAHIRRPMFNFNLWGVQQYVKFERMDMDGEGSCDPNCEPVTNDAPPMIEPAGGVAFPIGKPGSFLDGSTFAFGLYIPTSPNMAFDANGAQRYGLINSLIWQIYAGPSVALHTPKVPWLTLGVGLQYTLLRANESLTVSAVLDYDGSEGSNPPAYSDSADSDVVLDLKSWDFFEPSANFGLLITPTPWLEIGASLQPPITYKARGDLSVEFNKDHFFNTLLEESEGPCDADKKMESGGCPPRTVDDDVLLTVTVPLILRAGVQVQPVKPLKVEAAFTWTQWSAGKALEISDVNLKLKTKDSLLQLEDVVVTDDVSIPTGFVDAWSLRLGGDLSLNEWARVSLGGYYESSAVPAERQGVAVVDTPKWGLGAGASFNIKKRASIDVSFGQQFLADRTITDSQVRQITLQTNPLNTQDSVVGEGLVVGNGRFESRLTFISLGGTVYFGKAE